MSEENNKSVENENSNLLAVILKYIFIFIEYIFLHLFEIIKINIEFFFPKSFHRKYYLKKLLNLWRDEYCDSKNLNNCENYSESIEVRKLLGLSKTSKRDFKYIAKYFYSIKMFNLSKNFYNKYYKNIFSSKRYYYNAICLTAKILNDYFYRNNYEYILELYIKILYIFSIFCLHFSLLLETKKNSRFYIYKQIGVVFAALNLNSQAKYYDNCAKNIYPKNGSILNNIALSYYEKDKKSKYIKNKKNMFSSVKYILYAMKYSTEDNQGKIFSNLITIFKFYNLNIKKFKSILSQIKFNDQRSYTYLAKNFEDIDKEETLYCLKCLSKSITRNLYQQICDYAYLIKKGIPKKYLKEYQYYIIYNTYLIFYHLNQLNLLKYFSRDEIKLPDDLKKKFINIIEENTK